MATKRTTIEVPLSTLYDLDRRRNALMADRDALEQRLLKTHIELKKCQRLLKGESVQGGGSTKRRRRVGRTKRRYRGGRVKRRCRGGKKKTRRSGGRRR